MCEQILSILASGCVCLFAIHRLNGLKARRGEVTFWRVLEVIGLAILAGGAIGTAAQWFIQGEDLHAETIAFIGAALFAIGYSRGRLAWDGVERRARPRPAGSPARGISTEELEANAFMHGRFTRRD